jgi:hypothetical protein
VQDRPLEAERLREPGVRVQRVPVPAEPVEQRLAASLAAALWSIARGASIVRVHDVAETVDALKVWKALQGKDFEAFSKDSHGT